jgi:hypothetical protein
MTDTSLGNNSGKDVAKQTSGSDRRKFLASVGGLAASVSTAPLAGKTPGGEEKSQQGAITLKTQGSLA